MNVFFCNACKCLADHDEDTCPKQVRPLPPSTHQLIEEECKNIKDLLQTKNLQYGDSALNPVRVFSKADKVEQLKVRIDDKLSRLARGSEAGEDVILDLLGYLVMLRIALKQ